LRTELLALAALGSAVAIAQVPVELDGPETLATGARATLEVRVHGAAGMPVLVTPRAEGAALEVVRGRLMRPDAVDPEAEPLVFRVPVVAREPGPARVRVRVRTFACPDGDECHPRETRVSRAIRVVRE